MSDIGLRPLAAPLFHWRPARAWRLPLAALACAALGFLTASSRLVAVWTTGAFFDTDDAMRMAQVRDLAAGQAWYDMTAWRLGPDGVFMHWSRIVDAPLLGLVRAFGLLADVETAERLARLAFPLLLTVALFVILVPLCERLMGPAVRWPALAMAVLSGPATGQFEPGRVDHHSAQIVLLAGAVAALARAVDDCPRAAALAGAAMALSLAISVENVPFFCALGLAAVALWVWRGEAAAPTMRWLALGLAAAAPLVFAATVAPSRWLLVAGDALSLAQASAMLTGAGLLAALAAAGRRLPSPGSRARVAGVGAVAAAAALLAVFPGLARDPFADVDPVARREWLDTVDEALPLLAKIAANPLIGLGLVAPGLVGLAGALRESVRASERDRAKWALVAAATAAGLATSLVMSRALASVAPLAVPGALALALSARERLARLGGFFAGPFCAALLILGGSSVGWAMACGRLASLVPTAPAADGRADFAACSAPAAYAALAALPPGLVLSEPDFGSFILAHTPHRALAGAYHRDGAGLRAAIEALAAEGETARRLVAATGASYVAVCARAGDARSALASRLARGDAPAWLRPVSSGPLRLFVVVDNRPFENPGTSAYLR